MDFRAGIEEMSSPSQPSDTLTIDETNPIQEATNGRNGLNLRAILCPGCSSSISDHSFPFHLRDDISSKGKLKRGFWDKRNQANEDSFLFRLERGPQGKTLIL